MSLHYKNVAIIGAGASGLVAMKELLEVGHRVITFEQSQEIGGLWSLRHEVKGMDKEYVFPCYESLQLNTCYLTSCFSDFPNLNKNDYEFPTHNKFLPYLHAYAEKFNLKKNIRFGCHVVSLKKDHETDQWLVTYKRESDNKEYIEIADRVIVAMRYGMACFPKFNNMDLYQGKTLHSSEWRSDNIFKHKKILVVGGSVSGADVVVKALRNDAKEIKWVLSKKKNSVLWAFNRFPYANRIPLDHALNRFDFYFPYRSKKFVRNYTYPIAKNVINCNPNLYKERACVVDTTIIHDAIENKHLEIAASIDTFTEDAVVLEDGIILNPDLVVFATGFLRYWSFLNPVITMEDFLKRKWYKFMLPIKEDLNGIAFLTQTSSYGSTFPTMEIQSRWLARKWLAKKKFSGADLTAFSANVNAEINRLKPGQSYFHLPDARSYRDKMAREIGCFPPILRYLFNVNSRKRLLALCILFGPIIPQHYRVVGPAFSRHVRNYIICKTLNLIGKKRLRRICVLWNILFGLLISTLFLCVAGLCLRSTGF